MHAAATAPTGAAPADAASAHATGAATSGAGDVRVDRTRGAVDTDVAARTDPAVARFGTLGPLEVAAPDGTPVFIGQRKRRRLLSLLLLHAGWWVSTEQICDALWEDDPPRSALGNIKTYVSELRHTLPALPATAAAGQGHEPAAAGRGSGRIASRDGEYAIRLAPGELDVEVFGRQARAGDEALAGGRPAEAARLLEQALGLWRGRPYDDLPADLAVAETARLDELRWNAWENLVDARLRLGQHGLVLPALRALTIEHPTRERLWGQLLIALDQGGRRAEALRAYQAAYRTLTERLGIEPGEELRALQQRILRGTDGTDGTAIPSTSTSTEPARARRARATAGPAPRDRRARRPSVMNDQ